MRLKQLEIKGFKSFADKTIINFDEGITGIIGPNGCGKSNIIDSIRWVIGEQKISSLRSENLEALVFNGSKTRSGSGLAEVSLTFENTKNLLPTEFSTVTVTRRYYKNGESEYRLNNVACRLKDIHNLFMDTGISNDSYAIIELAMVDDIIKDKDNSRRRMLEQAAGITIYKTRKKEATLKLDATEMDLNRIEDLLFEINNQVKTLESQARKAEKYYEIKKDYRESSIELAKASLEGYNETYQDLTAKLDISLDEKTQLDARIATEEAALENEKLKFTEAEKSLHENQQRFNALMQSLKNKENDRNLAAQKLSYLLESEKNLQEFLQNAEGQLNTIQDSIRFSELQVNEETKSLSVQNEKLITAREDAENARSVFDAKRKVLDVSREGLQQIQRSQFEAEKKVAVADTLIQNLQRTRDLTKQEQENKATQLEKEHTSLGQLEVTLAEKKSSLETLIREHEDAKNKILATQEALEVLRNELMDANRKLDAKRNEFNLLKSLVDSMEGYPESVKFLHGNKEWNTQAPLLSDILYVQEEYRTSIENLLEPFLNYYVVQTMEEGFRAVHLLTDHKKGKANFFILDKIATQSFSSTKPANCISALDIVEVDDAYFSVAKYLLANVFIAENDDVLMEDLQDVILIDKNGRLVKGPYSLRGGSTGLFEGQKIGRAKNLEKMQDEIILQDAVVNALKSEMKQKQDDIALYSASLKEQQVKASELEIQQMNNELFRVKNKIETTEQAISSGNLKLEEIIQKLEAEQKNIEDTRTELSALNNQLANISDELKTRELDFHHAEDSYNKSSSIYNESNLQVTRQQNKISGLQQELKFKTSQLTELHERINHNTIQFKKVQQDIVESKVLLDESEKALVEFLQTKEVEEKKLNTADQSFYNFRNELQQKESALRNRLKEKEHKELHTGELKDRMNELKLQLAGMKERLQVEFNILLEDILSENRATTLSVDDLQENCQRMKKRLDNMGEINSMAIEAFTEMKKRYDFIIEQKQDLVSAKESLLQTIREVGATANHQFLETFNKVRDHFQQVFKALFTEEDTADLILDNPENLAETGIEIIAKPKGKRPSSITQLSGGEKTLTATALLFSIYLIKPAPFCILDEVDAPLDDVNVNKFTQMIQQFSTNSQFIIITHNKMTMSAVDVIYGVTMQEAGVSKLVPVDFRSLK
ncbi:MAG: chromosome segregation protein SMC [Bacteroidetes bacterium]|nr:chromosome segregation protein SMC [Bacteroidota bacterium]